MTCPQTPGKLVGMKFYRFGLCSIAALMCTALYCPQPAYAQWETPTAGGKLVNEPGFQNKGQITIPARSAAHDGYSRMVLDWPSRVSYKLTEPEKGVIVLGFQRRAVVDTTDVRQAPETNIGHIEVISGLNKPLQIAISIPPDAKYKVYNIGYKVVLDVEDVPGQKRGVFKIVKAKPVPQTDEKEPEDVLPTPVQDAEPVNEPVAIETKPVMIDWTETRNFNAAVFTRYGQAYFVTDNVQGAFAPRVAGDNAAIAKITEIPAEEGGKVYRLSLPQSKVSSISASSEKLGWTFTINPAEPPQPRSAGVRLTRNDKAQQAVEIAMPATGKMVKFSDPDTGEDFTVLPAANSMTALQSELSTPDFELVPSSAGVVVRPLNDGLSIEATPQLVSLSLPNGGMNYGDRLALAEPETTAPQQPAVQKSDQKRLLYFTRWLAGLPEHYAEGRQMLEQRLSKAKPEDKATGMLDLSRFELAHGYGPESLGYLELALEAAPALNRSVEYRALRGVGLALMGDGDNAIVDLRDPALNEFPEMGLWRAYALAQQYAWDDAYKAIPMDTSALSDYPMRIQTPLILSLAEVLLRKKDTARAERMLNILENNPKKPDTHQKAAIAYLRGEAERVKNQPLKAIEMWNQSAKSKDQLYRVKSILAQTVLQMHQRAIKPEEAIEKLERLRFAWRGDGLETQIAQVLGRLYMNNQQWDEAFELMRGAAGVAEGTEEGDAITASMTQSFSQLYTNPPKELKPLAAVSLYDRFPELVPPGEEGKAVMRGVADYLLRMDLLERAGGIYKKLLAQDKNNVEIMHDGLQLTAIQLLAREPEDALKTLQGEPILSTKGTADQERQRRLLAAKAFADLKRYDDAIGILEKLSADKDSLALIADTAWAAEKWELAARALNVLLKRSNPDMENLSDEQTSMMFNQAVALKLANNSKGLANLRTQYLTAIKDKNKRTQFEVLTRPSQEVTLADRQTLLDMTQEVDMFQSFLTQPTAVPAAAPAAAPAAPAPAAKAEEKPKEE